MGYSHRMIEEEAGQAPPGTDCAELLERIETLIYPAYKVQTGINGVEHVRRAVHFAGLLAQVECPGQVEVVVLGASLHDVGRLPGRTHQEETLLNLDHGERGAEIAARILERHFPEHDPAIICEAVALHARGLVSSNPIIGSIWDGDRLDLFRLKADVRTDLFSTQTATVLLPYAKNLVPSLR
jgi:putative nucleotidyltransferase with HDIG domain